MKVACVQLTQPRDQIGLSLAFR